ncbi:cysteinyl leukotriene receptor 2 [Mugil cephalus]|uniref:cysteinyl leukotriene receptor 2 n=1 Tax=Mugil cephalus TaxID=48193 RepID=UPI001FB6E4ED|nr:cysteinyl leukotriene receptor 2 [Mugil cephalus]
MNDCLLASPTMAGNNTTQESLITCVHTDDAFKYIAYIVTYLLVFPMAFFGNFGALVVFFMQRKRSSASSVVMINLAISDGGFSLSLPLRLAYYFRDGMWPFPDWVCRLCVYGFYVNLYTSILFLTLLSVLRWMAVNKPLIHRKHATSNRALLACLGIWLFVFASSAPFLFDGISYRNGQPRCFEPSNPTSWTRVLILNYVAVLFGFMFPFLTIVTCYSRLVKQLTSPSDFQAGNKVNKHRSQTRARSVHLVAMVTATFLLCFLPYHVIRSLHLHAMCSGWKCSITRQLQRAVVVTLCLAASNSMINPLLYYYSTRTFRAKMKDARSSFRSSRGNSFRSGRMRKRSSTMQGDSQQLPSC